MLQATRGSQGTVTAPPHLVSSDLAFRPRDICSAAVDLATSTTSANSGYTAPPYSWLGPGSTFPPATG
eukprot:6463854-Amphidinium_carterae.5